MEQPKREPINNLDYKARRVLILGVSRSGKSTLASRLVYSHPAPLILIYDWQGCEFATRCGGSIARTREEVGSQIENGRRIVCYDAEKGEADPKGGGFLWFCEMVFEVGGCIPGRKLFVVDESQDLIDPYHMPEPLGDILSRGGRRMIDTCMIGRSANALQTESRDQVTELYCFRLVDGNSLKYPASLKLDPDQVQSLPDTHFLYKDLRTGEQKKLALYDQED